MNKIGISLSGGGFRASVFHLGVLKSLAEKNYLEKIHIISTVSGGSLAIALVFKLNNNQWPTSKEYLDNILPKIDNYFTILGLGGNSFEKMVFSPSHWRNLFSRANIIADSLKTHWKITDSLNNLPDYPIWEINATTNETGKNWRFSKEKMGDYQFGVIHKPFYNISNAVAASASFPGLIGRFSFNTVDFNGWEKFNWNTKEYKKKKEPQEFDLLHLSDGGLYNNLGEEALFEKFGEKLIDDIDFLIVSDATKSLAIEESKPTINILGRTLRLIDITMEQIKLLRIRAIHNFLNKNKNSGIFIQIGQYNKTLKNEFDLKEIKKIKTSIFTLSQNEYDTLLKYGSRVTDLSIERHFKTH